MERKRKIYVAKVSVIMGAIPMLLWAHSSGPVSGKAGVPGESTCNQAQCHVGTAINGGGGSVKVAFPGNFYTPGLKQHLVVTIADPTARIWGFQLTARPSSDSRTMAGSFTSTDRTTAVVCNVPPFIDIQDVFLDFGGNQNCPANRNLAYIEHTTNGSSRLQSGSQTYEFDWTPPATAVGNITLYVAGNAGNANGQEVGDHIYTATYALAPAPASSLPAIDSGGVQNGASFQPGIVPGSWLTIKGTNLSPVTDTWDNAIAGGKLPTSLDGVKVTVGGQSAFVNYVSPGQINVQAPDVPVGLTTVTVTNAAGTSATMPATVTAQAPAFFIADGKTQAVATRNSDAQLVAKEGTFPGIIPAKPGDVLILWGTGFGPTNPPVAAGIVTPGDKQYNSSPVTVKIGSADVQVFGAALSQGFVGLYQVAIQVPASMADGDYPLVATVSGVSSPASVTLSVKK